MTKPEDRKISDRGHSPAEEKPTNETTKHRDNVTKRRGASTTVCLAGRNS